MIDETHDPAAMSWVDTANAHPEFPVQNLAVRHVLERSRAFPPPASRLAT